MKKRKLANLRTCASCEWIWKLDDPRATVDCPKCKFGSYGAHRVYGSNAYRYHMYQIPWREKQLQKFEEKLRKEIHEERRKCFREKHKRLSL